MGARGSRSQLAKADAGSKATPHPSTKVANAETTAGAAEGVVEAPKRTQASNAAAPGVSAPSPPPGAPPLAAGEWQCPACTFLNKAGDTACCMCHTAQAQAQAQVQKPAAAATTGKPQQLKKRNREPALDLAAIERIPDAHAAVPPELQEAYTRLRAVLLSPESRTDQEGEGHTDGAKAQEEALDDARVLQILREAVPEVDKMHDRTHKNKVSALILSTYHSGLPLYEKMPVVRQHTALAMRFIFGALVEAPLATRHRHLQRIAECFTACQAEQGRVIDSVYGALSGRDRGLKEQVYALVDDQKQRVLDQVSNVLNPDAWKTGDGHPQMQLPHIQSSYRLAVGAQLGLRGVDSARADRCAFALDATQRARVEGLFRKLFSVGELVQTLVDDVNQQSVTADRLIDRDVMCKWAAAEGAARGFNPHTLYYDEDRAAEFEGLRPEKENEYQPFLSKETAIRVLTYLFL